MAPTWLAISSVALAVWLASDLTSEATTAKPRPASPARAASIVALSASRLVWPAIAWIKPTTSPMRVAASPSSDIERTVRLPGDLADRGGEFLDRAGRGGDVAGRDPHPLLGGAGLGGNRIGGAIE